MMSISNYTLRKCLLVGGPANATFRLIDPDNSVYTIAYEKEGVNAALYTIDYNKKEIIKNNNSYFVYVCNDGKDYSMQDMQDAAKAAIEKERKDINAL